MVTWDIVTRAEVLRAIQEYERLGPRCLLAGLVVDLRAVA